MSLISLSNDLFQKYILKCLSFDYDKAKDQLPCHKTYNGSYELYCSDCGNPARHKFEQPEDFSAYVEELTLNTADEFGGDDLYEWWPWVTFSEILSLPKKLIIEIPEQFEQLMLLACEGPHLTTSEKKILEDFKSESDYKIISRLNNDDICELSFTLKSWDNCELNNFSSRTCEKGTRSCVKKHGKQ